MKSLSVILFLAIYPFVLHSQTTFEQTFGGAYEEYAHSIKQTPDGGFILCGYTKSMGNGLEDVFVVKTDAQGNQEWSETFGGEFNDHGYYIACTNDGGYIYCGTTNSNWITKAFVSKINSIGEILWMETFPGYFYSNSRHLLPAPDNGYIVCGATSLADIGETDAFIFKIDSTGQIQWSKTYGGEGYENLHAMCNTNDNGYLFVGSTTSFGAENFDLYIIKTNAAGDTLWTKMYGGGGYDGGFSVHQTTDNNYVIGVESSNFGSTNLNMVVLKINDEGNILWASPVSEDIIYRGCYLTTTSDDCIAGTGWSHDYFASIYQLVMFKMNNEGELLWTQVYGGDDYDQGLSIVETSDLGLAVGGATFSYGAGMSDMYLVKTTSNGTLTSTNNYLTESPEILLYPNPCSNSLWLKSKDIPQQASFINAVGKVWQLSHITNNGITQFNTSNFPRGLYIVKLSYTGKTVYLRVVVK